MRSITTFAAALLVAACGTEPSDPGTDASADVELSDTSTDAIADAEPDVAADTSPDTSIDTNPDVSPDVSPDTDPDVEPDSDAGACVPGVTTIVCADGREIAIECPCIDGAPACPPVNPDALCGTSCEPIETFYPCPDGSVVPVACPCVDGEPLCPETDPATLCPATPTLCSTDSDCGPADTCDPCGTSSCPGCEDCVAACVPHGCPTEPEAWCDRIRPTCDAGQVSVVEGGCWSCVSTATCGSGAEGCAALGGECAGDIGFCAADTVELSVSLCSDGSSCCLPGPSSCDSVGGSCTFWMDGCGAGTLEIPELVCNRSQICCVTDPTIPEPCGDGSALLCFMAPPTCADGLVAGVFEGCWRCVAPSEC